jgi:hypothetical protein
MTLSTSRSNPLPTTLGFRITAGGGSTSAPAAATAPPSFSKTDLAKYLNAWDRLPYLVSFGNQTNFQSFMQTTKEQYPAVFYPDEA